MVLHPQPAPVPTPGSRTWRTWRTAWADAAYGPDGFWSTQQPHDHFTTAVGVGPLVAQAVAGLVPAAGQAVVDVGSGDGRLLSALADLLPDVALVGVDRRARPTGLPARVRWFVDHWDVDAGRWVHGGPPVWLADAAAPLLVAHEWLDDLPAAVVARAAGTWREVEVDPAGHERPGGVVPPDDLAWLARWWDEGRRAEVGHSRDVAWAGLVGEALRRHGRALAVDYGHLAGRRPRDGAFTAYGRGRRRAPVPDGRVNLTAGVALDALVAAGEAVGAATLRRERQSVLLGRPAPEGPPRPVEDPLASLVRRGERAALTASSRWGDLWWLLQGAEGGTS
jgi:hypothetical protein